MNDFVDQHRNTHGVEPICKVLQIAPSAYRRHAARQRTPTLRSARARRDEVLVAHIERVWRANLQVYGADKVWRQLQREGVPVARCTVERLMRRQGLRGVIRGRVVRTTIPDPKAPCPLDKVNRQFKAARPNQLWVSDFTYVSTWQGWLYVAFVIDVFARRIVGWRVSSSMRTDFVLDALEQAETINGLYKAELIHRRAPWRTKEAVELATLEWVAWFNHHRLMAPLGYVPPAEYEANYYRNLEQQAMSA